MEVRVITLQNIPQSVKVADRCIKSAKRYEVEVSKFNAITPSTYQKVVDENNINTDHFREIYSRYENALSAFCSHFSLWQECAKAKTPYVILEHDAVFKDSLPNFLLGDIVNLGEPSYGRFNIPNYIGEGELTSKAYLPGAHAYYITPKGARQLIEQAQVMAKPTDVFIHVSKFKINEYNPWPVKALDSFTTIQKTEGIKAKHSYMKTGKMDIIDV
tara:strand:+ start:136 stop:783 length:648 start_codon:yes stop_codon:yes gene_type:complete